MSPLNTGDPQTYWLVITNLVLGAVVAICAVVMLGGIAHEVIHRWRAKQQVLAEIDRDFKRLTDDHAFDVPGLGLTMADGGERLSSSDQADKR